MLCSLCLKQKNNYFQLTCNHNVCFECIPKESIFKNILQYQCQTCLTFHEIDLKSRIFSNQNQQKQLSRTYLKQNQRSNEFSSCIFCWTCYESLTLNSYIKGRHHNHSVQSFEEAIPSIKTLMMQQFQITSFLKQILHQNKLKLENNNLRHTYENIKDKINNYFYQQIQIIDRKRQKILNEIRDIYQNNLKQIQKQLFKLQPIIDHVELLENKINDFINDSKPITSIEPIRQMVNRVQEYQALLKEKIFVIPEMPQFIIKSSLKQFVETLCILFFNKPAKESNKHQDIFSKTFIKQQQRLMNLKLNQNLIKFNQKQIFDHGKNKKVRLVEKLKDKMKYSSSTLQNSFS